MKKKIISILFIFSILFFVIFSFYINQRNYIKIKEIKSKIINHPEMLPQKEYSKYLSFGFSNLRADLYWIETIQYIGSNALGAEYKKYLYTILDLVTELNPYFEKPYVIGMLLLPSYNERYEKLDNKELNIFNQQAEKLGLKGIKNFCDPKKIDLLLKENDLGKIWSDKNYLNPCKSNDIPFNLGFVYFYYLKTPAKAADYYKIASANKNSTEGAKIMAAVMSGKGGNREKSIIMFLTLAEKGITDIKKQKVCSDFKENLKSLSYSIFREGLLLDSKILKDIDKFASDNFSFNENDDKNPLKSDDCSHYINKTVREFNLLYLDEANKKFKKDNNKNSLSIKELYEKKYIDYIPKDFQQYKDYGVIYKLDLDTGFFDYEMGNFKE